MAYFRVRAEFILEADSAEEAEQAVDILGETATSSFSLDGEVISYRGACAVPEQCEAPPWVKEG